MKRQTTGWRLLAAVPRKALDVATGAEYVHWSRVVRSSRDYTGGMKHSRRRVTAYMRVITPLAGIAHFQPGDLLTVYDADDKVYRVSSKKHGRVNVPVWKILACTREVGVGRR